MKANRESDRQAGFTLVEALVALLVMAFGMLAIAGFQTTMSHNSDVAKQRSEAVRLAQLKIEELRAFETVVGDGAGTRRDYADDVVNGSDTLGPSSGYTTNTSYTRTWAVTHDGLTPAVGNELQKWIRVDVAWTDRANEAQSVTLRSVIARNGPVDLSALFTGPGGAKVRRPKNRNIDVPYRAVDLGSGKSGFKPTGSNDFYVFDNGTGNIVKICFNSTPTLGFDTTGCTNKFAYQLSGFIRFARITHMNEPDHDAELADPQGSAFALTAQVRFVSPSTGPHVDCFVDPPMPTAANTYVSYLCVVEPADHDADGDSPSSTPRQWSGQFVVTAGFGASILCRYSGDYVSDDVMSNSENPLTYRGVAGNLDNQNYVFVPSSVSIPSMEGCRHANIEFDPEAGELVNLNTFLHQNASGVANGEPSSGSQWEGGGETGGDLPML